MAKDWKYLERVVQLVEKSIAPDAIVEHDVRLPVIGSNSGRSRQCDVIVRSGKKPRETLTIVEVQDRGSAVDINTFGGWIIKMSEVGAQHLICVSRENFPTSVKEKAAEHGGGIVLVQIEEGEPQRLPINFARINPLEFFSFEFTNPPPDVEIFGSLLDAKQYDLEEEFNSTMRNFDINQKIWSYHGDRFVSLYNIILDIHRYDEALNGQGELNVPLRKDSPLELKIGDHWIKVGLLAEYRWAAEIRHIPANVLRYTQIDHGELAWIFEFIDTTEGGIGTIAVPIVEHEGQYAIHNMYADVKRDLRFTIGVKPGDTS